jgi:hypothetical protein
MLENFRIDNQHGLCAENARKLAAIYTSYDVYARALQSSMFEPK